MVIATNHFFVAIRTSPPVRNFLSQRKRLKHNSFSKELLSGIASCNHVSVETTSEAELEPMMKKESAMALGMTLLILL